MRITISTKLKRLSFHTLLWCGTVFAGTAHGQDTPIVPPAAPSASADFINETILGLPLALLVGGSASNVANSNTDDAARINVLVGLNVANLISGVGSITVRAGKTIPGNNGEAGYVIRQLSLANIGLLSSRLVIRTYLGGVQQQAFGNGQTLGVGIALLPGFTDRVRLAVTPTTSWDEIRITFNYGGVLNLGALEAYDVYYAFASAVALPVNLKQFNATAREGKVDLFWQTADEKGNSHFEVQHSRDGLSFEPIGNVKGAGNTSASELRNYNFIHEAPKGVVNYYRLKQVDVDGKSALSKIQSAFIDPDLAVEVNVYPNPSSSVLNTVITRRRDLNLQQANLQLIDGQGRVILTRNVKLTQDRNEVAVDVSTLASGQYFVRLNDTGNVKVSPVKVLVGK